MKGFYLGSFSSAHRFAWDVRGCPINKHLTSPPSNQTLPTVVLRNPKAGPAKKRSTQTYDAIPVGTR